MLQAGPESSLFEGAGRLTGGGGGAGGGLRGWGVGSHFAGESRSMAASSTFRKKVLPQSSW